MRLLGSSRWRQSPLLSHQRDCRLHETKGIEVRGERGEDRRKITSRTTFRLAAVVELTTAVVGRPTGEKVIVVARFGAARVKVVHEWFLRRAFSCALESLALLMMGQGELCHVD